MASTPITVRESQAVRLDCALKLKATRVSGNLKPILGYLLGLNWGTPQVLKMRLTPQGQILGRCRGDLGFQTILGSYEALMKELDTLAKGAGLNQDEFDYLLAKVSEIQKSA